MSTFTLPPGLAELGERRQFVAYKQEPKPNATDGKLTKIPYQVNGAKASSTDSATWDTFAAVAAACAAGRFDGPGFVFSADDPYFFIDIDGCRDPETKRLTMIARAAVALTNTYAEPSPSGTGIHIIGRGTLPQHVLGAGRQGKKRGAFEAYQAARFGTMTCQPIGIFNQINDVDDDIMVRLCAMFWPEDTASKVAAPVASPLVTPTDWDDSALLEHAFAAKHGEDFRQQHNGVQTHSSPSEGDFGYLGHLFFWCQGDPHRMRRIALASARVRDKWDSRRGDGDWLDYSIANIIKQGGAVYQGTYHTSAAEGTGDHVAHACPRCGELEAALRERDGRIAQLDRRLTCADEAGERTVRRVTELETENAALEAAIRHPVQAAGIGTLDQVEAAQRAYQRGDVVTLGGEDFARVPATTAAKRRSAKTLTTGLKALIGLTPGDPLPREPVAFGRDRAFAVFARSERIETPTFKGEVDIPYIFIPEALRGQRGKAVLGILPTCAEPKQHGGRRTIPVPPEVAAQSDPVRRKREHVTRWYAALTDQPLATQTEHLGTDYWTAQGEALTFEQITQQRVAEGYEPPRVPAYRPTQPPLRLHRAEPRQLAEVSHSMAEPRQLADSLTTGTCRQDAEVYRDGEPRHLAEVFAPTTVEPGHCPDCGAQATIGGYCAQHFNGHLERHRATWAYAQVGD